MNLRQSFILALKSLQTSKMRSFLTMLGIIIGVSAVIILVSVIDGFKSDLVGQFESLGANLLSVNISPRGGNREVDPDDMFEIVDENPELLSYCSPMVSVMQQAKFGTETSSTTTISGVSEDFDKIQSLEISQGRFLQYMDMSKRAKNCVVGSYIANEYFDGNAIGQVLKIGGNTFTIVGVLEEKADSAESTDDDKIYIPYTLSRTLNRSAKITSYRFSVADKEKTDQAKQVISDVLYKVFSNSNAYTVSAMTEMIDMIDELTGKLTLILVGIAAISLLVGGIGIMNIMLVSVTERTREIGIRKSLGAKKFDILSQFVVEAATTSACGGILGIILGIIAAMVLSKMLGFAAVISVGAVLIAFSVSVGIGIIFGYMPAGKAAKLNPIDALRHD